jgi:hypothetical protein
VVVVQSLKIFALLKTSKLQFYAQDIDIEERDPFFSKQVRIFFPPHVTYHF